MPKRLREEEKNQIALVTWFRYQYPQFYDNLFMIPNGENVGAWRMKTLKQMGLVPGVPDLFLSVYTMKYPGMFIEMKSINGRCTLRQLQVHKSLENQHYKVVVPHGWTEAREEIENYMLGYVEKYVF